MCPLLGKGTRYVDVERQAWVRKHPKPAEPKESKHHGWNRPKITRDPNVTRRLQQVDFIPPPIYPPPPDVARRFQQGDYGLPPPIYPPEPARPAHELSDEGRSRHDDRGLGHAQSTRSQHKSHVAFVDDDSDNELEGEPIHESGISELGGLPTHGQRDGGLRHHGSRGPSRGQHDGRGRSRAQSNASHSGPGQSRYDFAPPADRMTAQYSVGHSQRGSEHQSQHGNQHGSHQGSRRESRR